jgi:hypothetical protein
MLWLSYLVASAIISGDPIVKLDERWAVAKLPNSNDCRQIVVECYNSRKETNTGRFELPKTSFDAFWVFFRNAKIDDSPIFPHPEIGFARVMTNDNDCFVITWYSNLGKGPVEFSLRGVRYYVPDGEWHGSLDIMLRQIYEKTK